MDHAPSHERLLARKFLLTVIEGEGVTYSDAEREDMLTTLLEVMSMSRRRFFLAGEKLTERMIAEAQVLLRILSYGFVSGAREIVTATHMFGVYGRAIEDAVDEVMKEQSMPSHDRAELVRRIRALKDR